MLVTNDLTVAIDFHSIFVLHNMEVNGYYQLFTSILQNVFFCVQQRTSYRFATTWGWVSDDRMNTFKKSF